MRPPFRFAAVLSAATVVIGPPAPAQNRPAPASAPYLALRALDVQVTTIGTRLAVTNAGLCREREYHAGLQIHDLSQYGRAQQPAVTAAFGLVGGPGVLALAEGGPAARAGLRLDDIILSADGSPLPRPPASAAGSYAPTERIIAALEAAFADGQAVLAIRRGSESLTIRVAADQGCTSRFQVVPSRTLEAKADGRYVQLSSAMVEFAADDDELAAFVAHELAHNILRHRARLNAAGIDRGLLAPFGRNGRLFRQTEMEADRLAVHLMAGAGYDPRAAVRLWTRQSRADSRLFAGTHPDWPDRIRALEQEIAAIDAARARGAVAPPPLPDGPLR